MILRLWRRWTAPDEADRYEQLIRSTIFPGILARKLEGLEGLKLHRRENGDETEFMTLMRFSTLAAVKAFAGPQWEISDVPDAAREVLSRFDERASHYDLRVSR